MKIILIIIGLIIVIAICITNALNVINIEQKDRNVESYHDFVPWIYTIVGILMLITAWVTYRLHFLIGIIQYGLGAIATGYGLYLLFIKIGWI